MPVFLQRRFLQIDYYFYILYKTYYIIFVKLLIDPWYCGSDFFPQDPKININIIKVIINFI